MNPGPLDLEASAISITPRLLFYFILDAKIAKNSADVEKRFTDYMFEKRTCVSHKNNWISLYLQSITFVWIKLNPSIQCETPDSRCLVFTRIEVLTYLENEKEGNISYCNFHVVKLRSLSEVSNKTDCWEQFCHLFYFVHRCRIVKQQRLKYNKNIL